MCGKDGTGMTTKVCGLIRSCAPRQDVKKWSTYVATTCTQETCLRETGKAPIKTGWAETDKVQSGKPNVRARWVAKEHKTHMCGLLRYSLYGMGDAAQNWEEELTSTFSSLKLTK